MNKSDFQNNQARKLAPYELTSFLIILKAENARHYYRQGAHQPGFAF